MHRTPKKDSQTGLEVHERLPPIELILPQLILRFFSSASVLARLVYCFLFHPATNNEDLNPPSSWVAPLTSFYCCFLEICIFRASFAFDLSIKVFGVVVVSAASSETKVIIINCHAEEQTEREAIN